MNIILHLSHNLVGLAFYYALGGVYPLNTSVPLNRPLPHLLTAKSDVTGLNPGVSHKFRSIRIIIRACLIKQPIGTLSLIYVAESEVSLSGTNCV